MHAGYAVSIVVVLLVFDLNSLVSSLKAFRFFSFILQNIASLCSVWQVGLEFPNAFIFLSSSLNAEAFSQYFVLAN